MIDALKRGVAAGMVGGVGYGLLTGLVVTPFGDHLEHLAAHGGYDHAHAGSALVSETTALVASVGGGFLWGTLLGAAFGAAYYLFEPALPGDAVRPYVLAGAGFLAVSVAPWTVLPPVPPGTEFQYPMSIRAPLYVGLLGVGALVAAASVFGYARTRRSRGRVAAVGVGLLPLAGLGLLGTLAPPMVATTAVSPEAAAAFRWLVVFGQAGLWTLVAAGYRVRSRADGPTAAGHRTATPRRAN